MNEVRVLAVDDSAFARKVIRESLARSPHIGWSPELVTPYVKNAQLFMCPADQGVCNNVECYRRWCFDFGSYVFNGVVWGPNIAGRSLAQVHYPSRVILAGEWPIHLPYTWHEQKLERANGNRNNVCFVDGHVKFIKMYWDGVNDCWETNPPDGYEYSWD